MEMQTLNSAFIQQAYHSSSVLCDVIRFRLDFPEPFSDIWRASLLESPGLQRWNWELQSIEEKVFGFFFRSLISVSATAGPDGFSGQRCALTNTSTICLKLPWEISWQHELAHRAGWADSFLLTFRRSWLSHHLPYKYICCLSGAQPWRNQD